MIVAIAAKDKIIVTIDDKGDSGFRLERRSFDSDVWFTFTKEGFVKLQKDETDGGDDASDTANAPVACSLTSSQGDAVGVKNGDFLDNYDIKDGLYAYRYIAFDASSHEKEDYTYSNWVRIGCDTQIGYTFGNYHAPDGMWGQVITEDDMRYTYLWGTDFKAANGMSYTDAQIKYFINASTEDIGRKLDITIKKKRVRCRAEERGLKRGDDYDVDEGVYDFRFSRISRYGLIKTKQRPIIKLHKLELLSRMQAVRDLTHNTIVDKNKGLLKFMERPVKPSETSSAIQTSIGMYGNETFNAHLFYAIDYDAGFETSDDVPDDLREIVGKNAAVSLLNIIGDGLMSGFSSSSLSMDGLSESFSSTQSATSAYFGARIKEYKDDIDNYIKANKGKFGHIAMGAL